MTDQRRKLERVSLYQQVWSQPMSRLAPTYGISDVMLKKICRQLDIPTPPRGYWAKVQNNVRVDKTKLPKAKIGQTTTYWIQKRDLVSPKTEAVEEKFSDEALQVLANINMRKPIKVAKRLALPHPLIEKTRTVLSKATTDQYGVLIGGWQKKILDIQVSPDTLSRALRLFDAMVKFFDREAVPVFVENRNGGRDTHVEIFGETVSFYLREPSRRTDHQLTEKEKKERERRSHSWAPRYDYHPSGTLVLKIDRYAADGVKRRWKDGKRSRVEDHIQEIVCNVIKIADLRRTRRIERKKQEEEWEKQRQRRAELARLRQIELERRDDLEKQATNWVKSQQLREYIQAVEMAAATKGISGLSHEGFAFWMRWANAHADRLDPLTHGLPFENDRETD
jgi:hypothetical protein